MKPVEAALITFIFSILFTSSAWSATCPTATSLEDEFGLATQEVFQETGASERLKALDKKITVMRSSYKSSKCVMYQSYLAVFLGMRNMFATSEKEQAKNFKESKGLFVRSISKAKRGKNQLNYLLSLKNQIRTYSYLPKVMTNERSEALRNLVTAESLLESLNEDKENSKLISQISKSLSASKQRLRR